MSLFNIISTEIILSAFLFGKNIVNFEKLGIDKHYNL